MGRCRNPNAPRPLRQFDDDVALHPPAESFTVKQICQWADNKKFTHLFVISERLKICNG